MQAVQFTVSISLEYSSMPQLSTVKIKTLKKKGEFDQFGFVTRSSSSTNLVSTTTPSIMAKLTVRKRGRQASREEDPPVSSKSGKLVRVQKNALLRLRRARNPCPKQKTFQKPKTLNISRI